MGEELEMNMQPTIFIRGNDGQFAEIGGIEKTEVTAGKCVENPFKKEIHLTIGKLSIDDEIALLELAFGNGRIRRFISRLDCEWRDKLYKNYE